MATIIPSEPEPQQEPQAKKQKEIPNKIHEALTTGKFNIAKTAYEECLENCQKSDDYRKFAAGPPKKVMMFNPRRRREKHRARMISYIKAKMNYENCVRQCDNDWYIAIIGLIGQVDTDLNEDVLREIFEMLQEKEQNLAKKKKKGGRKTRRKKGTRRKRKTRKGKTRKRKRRK